MRRKIRRLTSLIPLMVVFSAILGGCTLHATYHPIISDEVRFRVPAQQATMYEAVDAAMGKLNFSELAGQKVVIKVVGVFPHTEGDLLDYMNDCLAYQLAKSGAVIVEVPRKDTDVVPELPSGVTYRVVLAVQEAGVDIQEKKIRIWPSRIFAIMTKKWVQGKVAVKVTAYPVSGGHVYRKIASAEGKQRIILHKILGFSRRTEYTTFSPAGFLGSLRSMARERK